MKTRLLLLSTILFSLSISAQIDFEAHVTVHDTGGTNNPQSVFAADLDGDGDMDMISASLNDRKIAWYENTDGQGNFGSQQIISEDILRVYSIYAADIDGDGDIDVVAAAITEGTIGWFENLNGQGTFGTYQAISTQISGATSVSAIDADGDGDMDVFATSSGDNKIVWYKNTDGQGNFGTEQIISTNFDNPIFLTSGDIDGDNDLDILSGNSAFNGSIVWFKNLDGQGTFIEQQILTTYLDYSKSATLADIDGDGDLDIAAVSRRLVGGPVALWFENTNGQGIFSNTPNIIAEVNNVDAVAAHDFDNDGDIDIAVGSSNAGIFWYKNNGIGNFGAQLVVDPDIQGVNNLFVTDLDNDGDSEILMSAGRADRIAWHENTNGQGNFSPANELADINGANGAYHLNSVDIDDDGDKDIVAALAFDNRVVWQENLDGQGTFSELKNIGVLDGTIAVDSGDIDGDGKVDVLAAGRSKIVWYKNLDGLGNFDSEQIIYLEQYAYSDTVYLTDIDNDGDLDVFSYIAQKLLWQENNGSGSFGPIQILSTEFVGCDSMVAEDIDSDGDKDLIVSDWGDGKIGWFENTDGLGSFSPFILIDSILAPDSIDVGDFDNDGDVDVVTLDYSNDKIMWYENTDGQANFGVAQIISNAVVGPFSLKAIDIDNDGDVDVLVSSYTSATLWLFQNENNGIFNSGQPFASEIQAPIFVTAADFNGDDKMDVLAPSYSNDEIIWFENQGPLSIEENTTNLFNIYPNPTNGFLNINSNISISEIAVYNNLGQLLFTSEEKNQIDISTLSEGIYFVKISNEIGQTETKKVIKI